MIHYTPYLEEVIRDPYPIYKRLRDEAPAYFVEDYNCWFLSRFEDIWQCEIDTEGFTVSEGLMPGQLAAPLAEQRAMAEMFKERAMGASVATLDPPQHTTLRSAVSPPFKPAAAARLEAFTRQLVRAFIDDFADKGECDIVSDLAMRTSVRVA